MSIKELAIGTGAALIVGLFILGVNVAPIVLVVAVVGALWMMPSVRGTMNRQRFGLLADVAQITFDDIGGQKTAKQELLEALEFICTGEKLTALGIRPLRGILLAGPPGTGKTLLARAAARHTGAAFMASSGSEFVEMYAGVGAQRIRELFARARQAACGSPRRSAIVFIDEIEVLAGQRGRHSSHLEYDQTLNQLLVELDGIRSGERERVLLIAATNRIDLLDPALLRPGRFDRIVNVGMPDREGRLHILRLHTRGKPLGDDVSLERIAGETLGFSGAHLESVTNEAAIQALREAESRITHAHFMEAIDKVAMGERIERRPSEAELRRITVHEAGHAIISELIRPQSVASITVASRGDSLGYVRQTPDDDLHLETPDLIGGQIAVLVAGAAAERIVCGGFSTGSSSDFERALSLGRRLVITGLSRLGVVHIESLPPELLHRTINDIVSSRLTEVEAELEYRRGLLEECAGVLMEREKLDGDELRHLLAEADTRFAVAE